MFLIVPKDGSEAWRTEIIGIGDSRLKMQDKIRIFEIEIDVIDDSSTLNIGECEEDGDNIELPLKASK
jgi:hypothetical protein